MSRAKKDAPTWRNRIVGEAEVSPTDLLANPLNYRVHPRNQVDALAGILGEAGWVQRVIVNRETGHIVDGHARVGLAISRKEPTVPVVYVDLTDAEEKLVLATLDPISAMATADKAILDELLADVSTGNAALQELIAKTAEAAGLEIAPDVGDIEEVDPDRADELQAKWCVQPGQLWIAHSARTPGRSHRLFCGDSADRSSVMRFMDGARATCVFTDPPYGVSIAAKNRLLDQFQKSGRQTVDIVDDDLSPDELTKKVTEVFSNYVSCVMADDCSLFVTAPQNIAGVGLVAHNALKSLGIPIRHTFMWMKNAPTFSMGLDYLYQHEPIYMTWGKRHKRPMRGEMRTSVWKVDKPRSAKEHPTMKPPELYVNAYLNNSDDGDIVADLYAGSGTVFVAAEACGRIGYGMEIEPRYVAVCLERMSVMGLVPELAQT